MCSRESRLMNSIGLLKETIYTSKNMKKFNLIYAIIIGSMVACSAPKQTEEKASEESGTVYKEAGPSGEIIYTADTVSMNGYFAHNQEGETKVPGILVIHEWWGHNDYARQRADMLGELGYVALAVDMYGDGKVAEHPEDAGKFSGMVMRNLPSAKARFEAAMNTLKNHPNVDPESIAAIGYCFGGSVALSMANAGYDLDAVAAFHSGVGLPIQAEAKPSAKILVCNGADDPFISPESIEAFKANMDGVEADYNYISYPGAVHSFTSKEADANGEKFGLPLAYNAAADSASWAEMQALFASAF